MFLNSLGRVKYALIITLSMYYYHDEAANMLVMTITDKSLSEALIFAINNPQYDDRLFIVHENCKLRIPAEHVVYSSVPNRRVGGNKRAGGKILRKH